MLHSFNLWFAMGLGLLWIATYFVWLRPWLLAYQRTAGILAAIEAGELKGFAWFRLRLKGARAAIVLFATSFFTGGWGLAEALSGVDPSALAPFQDSMIWKAVLRDEMALRAAAIASLVAAVLVLKGKLHDVRIVPDAAALGPTK